MLEFEEAGLSEAREDKDNDYVDIDKFNKLKKLVEAL